MGLWGFLRWTGFLAYVGLLLSLPLLALFRETGLWIGIAFCSVFFIWMGRRGHALILAELQARTLQLAEVPGLYRGLEEFCRRLGMKTPAIALCPLRVANVASFGFSAKSQVILLTQGALDELSREETLAALARELVYVRNVGTFRDTWLGVFLITLEGVLRKVGGPSTERKPLLSLRRAITEILIFPLIWIPIRLLRSRPHGTPLDLAAAKLVGSPEALSNAFRKIQISEERKREPVSFSCWHFFLLPPVHSNSLTRLLFGSQRLTDRISGLAGLYHVQSPLSSPG